LVKNNLKKAAKLPLNGNYILASEMKSRARWKVPPSATHKVMSIFYFPSYFASLGPPDLLPERLSDRGMHANQPLPLPSLVSCSDELPSNNVMNDDP
jgi:hypothetical protein